MYPEPSLPNHFPIPLDDSIQAHSRSDFTPLRQNWTIAEALANIRRQGLGEKIVYFYIVDEEDKLVGVAPTRRLLTTALDKRLGDIMDRRVLTIPQSATVLEACEFFLLHKFFAFPVVDDQGRLRGVVDVGLFTREMLDLAERDQAEAAFETLGFHLDRVKGASALRAFQFRFPWLMATIASGVMCAWLTSVFEVTLAKSLVLAFFMALVLGLGESVGIQSMTMAIQTLRLQQPTWRWYGQTLVREVGVTSLLGAASGLIVGLVVVAWQGVLGPALVIGLGIWLSLTNAGWVGLTLPTTLHALRLDPKIAAGPLTLALADLCTLLFYFLLAAALLT